MKFEITKKESLKVRIDQLNKTIESAKNELEFAKHELEIMNQLDDSSFEDHAKHVIGRSYKYENEFIYVINAQKHVPINDIYGILNYDTVLITISIKTTEDGCSQIRYNDNKYVLYSTFMENAIEIPSTEFNNVYSRIIDEMSSKIVI